MSVRLVIAISMLTLISGCGHMPEVEGAERHRDVQVQSAVGRIAPARVYGADSRPRPLVVISNGYGGSHRAYGFIADNLVARGFVVVSIQQDLPTDPPIPNTGVITEVRRPYWERGADLIDYTIGDLRRSGIANNTPVVLIGHSHGGDISMLYASRRPDQVRAVISLDNRRAPFPRTSTPRVCSIRSSDQIADPGVLPSENEQRTLNMLVQNAVDLRHDDMWDGGPEQGRRQILELIAACLELPPH